MTESIDDLKAQLRYLDEWASSVLSETAAGNARETLEKRLLAAVMAAPPAQPPAAPAVPAATPERAIPPRLAWGLAVFVLVFGAAGYALLGNREAWTTVPATASADTAAAPSAAASAPHAMTTAQIEGMVDSLAARLKNEPDNAEGWLMLGRSYSVLGQFDPAIRAYRHVLTLQPKNAQALADLADALAMTHGRSFNGEPAKLVEQALAADGTNLKALLLAGTIAFDKKDYATAARHWDLAQKAGPADSDLVKQARENLAEARQLAGLPPASPEAAASAPAAGGPSISGRVELAPALAGKAAPEDTVFVFARPSEGSRMPLAILKKRVRDLPLLFTLDDQSAMSPQARLSQAARVVVGARVSKSGQAMPQPGDLQALSSPVAPGASGLRLVIADVVR